jgi:peptidoglycan hydrolase-like protein with peptidoglycan-binding domain
MRSWLTATLILMTASASVPQMSRPSNASTKPKRVTTVPVARPGLQTPTDTANAMAPGERLALQSDLAWVGEYNGAITGDVSERMVAAIKEYQKSKGGRPSGVLNPQERAALAETARRRQDSVGWKIVTDPGTGVRLGIPTKLAPQQTSDTNGVKWSSPSGSVLVALARRKEAGATTAKLAEREKKEPPGRTVDYTVVKPDFFVLSGLQGLKKFYVRGAINGDEVRVLTILYDQAMETTVEPVVIAMSSAFTPFPTGATAGPPPRKIVEYGTGVVVTEEGTIVADREVTDGCLALKIGGYGSADLVGDDRDRGLALLRIYGAHGLKPLALTGGAANSSVDIVGIADPQNQGGASAVSSVKASLTQTGSGRDLVLSPPPAIGFSGAVALDGSGKFAGIALLKPVAVTTAAPSNAATPISQAVLVQADAVREFLKHREIDVNGTSIDARMAVVRVICVRK